MTFPTHYVLYLFMEPPATPSVLTRLTMIIDGLCRAVAARTMLPKIDRRSETVLAVPLVMLVLRRLRRAEAVILSLATRFRAGLLKPSVHRAPPAKPRTRTTTPARVLPRHFAWLCPLVPCEAAIRGNHLRLLLEEPEMQALIAASPRARRILGPTCRMLGIEPGLLAPPKSAPAPVMTALVAAPPPAFHLHRPAEPLLVPPESGDPPWAIPPPTPRYQPA